MKLLARLGRSLALPGFGLLRHLRTGWCLGLAAVLLAGSALAQPGNATGLHLSHFTVAPERYGPPHETQIKTLLEGASAEQAQTGRNYLVHQAVLRTFREDGGTNLVISAPECLYDSAAKTVDSAGPLTLQSGDGRFILSGRGFLWRQDNSSLLISNEVHTWAYPGLLTAGGGNATNASPSETNRIEITSDRFEYETNRGLGTYTGNVRAWGTNLDLSGGQMTLKIPLGLNLAGDLPSGNQLESITADTNLVMDYNGIHTTCQHARYSALNGQALLTGHPAWHTNLWAGRGDEIFLDRTNRIMRTRGKAFLKMPAQGSGASGFLGSQPQTNAAALTNQTVEILSDHYEIRTNWARFEHAVRVTQLTDAQPQGTMTCERMNALFGSSNQLQQLIAEQDVRIEHEDQQFASGHAVYHSTNGLLELTQQPSWRAGLRNGNGDFITVDTRTNAMTVQSNAFMRLPAGEFGQPGAGPGRVANRSPTNAATGPVEFADVYSSAYVVGRDAARFWGNVTVLHPQLSLSCAIVTVQLPPTNSTSKGLEAEGGVDFITTDPKGQEMHGTGDKLVYSFAVVSGQTNESMTLYGQPALLEGTNSTFRNDVIVLDPAHNRIKARGTYHLTFVPSSKGTNSDIERHLPKPMQIPKAK